MKQSIYRNEVRFFRGILKDIGEEPEREGLRDTPKRIIKSYYNELFRGYREDPGKILKAVFKEDSCDEMVVLKDIEFYSTCEHHMLPFFGKINIGYVPDNKIIGVSKLARLVDIYSRRLQIQERLTTQIGDVIMEYLKPKGVMVVIEAKHLCMIARGVKKQNAIMVTSAIKGVFQKNEVRTEFLRLTN